MRNDALIHLLGLAFALGASVDAASQGPPPSPKSAAAPVAADKATLEALKGAWVRPDGGYTIVIKGVGPSGELDAMYFNPRELPFAKAQAARDGGNLRVSLELQAGGYSGSTYELTFDPATDRLKGIYYQAVAKQKFEVYFVRKGKE